MNLQGKCALVTGSTSGIGLGIARVLHRAGASIVLHGLGPPEEIASLRDELGAAFLDADLRDGAAYLAALERLGSVDVLVNNAGIQHTAPVEEFAPERWQAVIDINLTAVFLGIHALLPGMRERGWGRILNVASVHGLVASVQKAAYVAAKHGVVGLTKVVALETAGSGITCNAICPGWVLTPLVQAQIEARAEREGLSVEEAGRRLLMEKQPGGRFVTPEELGEAVLFCCSQPSMTGASLPIDGAWLAQ